MKYLFIIWAAVLILISGCGKDPQAESVAAETAEPASKVEAETKSDAMSATAELQKLGNAAMQAASSLDWSNLSWNDISSVPYEDKEKLLAWAMPQIDSLKDQITKAALAKGKMSLSSLSDTGWQGTLKTAVEALEQVRNSSPETWELARGALIAAWDALQKEAAKYAGEG